MSSISTMKRIPEISLPISNSSQIGLMGRDESYDKESSSDEAFEFLVEPRGFDRWSITKNNREGNLRATTQLRKKQKQYDGTGEGDSDSSYLSQGSEIAIDMLAHWDCKRTWKKNQNPLHISSNFETLSNHQSPSREGKLLNELDIAHLKNAMLSRPTIRSEEELQDIAKLIKPRSPASSDSIIVMNGDNGNRYSREQPHLENLENDQLRFMPTELSETHV